MHQKIGVGEQATWHGPLSVLLPWYATVADFPGPKRLRARVVLAGGRIVESASYPPPFSETDVAAFTRRARAA
jgi:hypothetical protein